MADIPKIRFKGFTEPWEQRKVSEYANFFTGNGLNWNDISDDGEQECILYGNLIWFKDIKCNPKYLDYAMSTADGQKKILASAIGSNQKALTMVKLNELEFMFPGKAEQDKIAEYFSYLDNLITLHQRKYFIIYNKLITWEQRKWGFGY